MNDCYYDKKDWRACRKEVSVLEVVVELPTPVWTENASEWRRLSDDPLCFGGQMVLLQRLTTEQMEIFRDCWKRHGNEQRTASKDV